MKRSVVPQLIYRLAVITVIVICAPWVAGQAQASIDACIDATCRISAADGGRGTGCAFERSQGHVYVLTAAHVVGNGQTVQCEFWRAGHQSQPLQGVVVRRSEEADAAVVAVPQRAFDRVLPNIVPIAPPEYRARPGQTVTSVGCAHGTWSTGFCGHVLGYNAADGSLRFTPTPANGRSGSAIFDAQGSQIIGLLRARTTDGSEGIATSLQMLYTALASAPESKTTNQKSETAQCPGGVCPTPGADYQYRLLPTPQYRQYESGRADAYNQGRSSVWPTLPPSAPAVPIDMGPTNARLQQIADLLVEIRRQQGPPAPSAAGPPMPDAADAALEAAEEAKDVAQQTADEVRQESGRLRQAVDSLLGDRATLHERFETRLAKVKEELGEEAGTRDVARAYVKDFVGEKLSDGSVGLSGGKILGGALGLSGPLALGIGVGLWFLSRRVGSKIESGEPLMIQRVIDRFSDKLDDVRDRVRHTNPPSGKADA